METSSKRLYRSRSNRMVAGILGGIGEHFDLDPVLVRIVFAVLFVATGFGPLVVLYLILWFVIPEVQSGPEDASKAEKKYFDRLKATKIILVTLIALILISGVLVAVKFFYHNVMIPWPYRHDLDNCIEGAKNMPTMEEMDFARYKCFRTYPHFL